MRPRRLWWLVALACAQPALAQPARGEVLELVWRLDGASGQARRAAGPCRAAVSARAAALADQLHALRLAPTSASVSALGAELSDLHTTATFSDCPDALLAGLASAVEAHEQLRVTLWSEQHGAAPGAPPAAPPPPPGRDCGTGADVGCVQTREGVLPVEKRGFLALLGGLKSERQEARRAQRATRAVASLYLTAAQFTRVLDLFPTDATRLELALALAHRVVNLGDALGYAARFTLPASREAYTQRLRQLLDPTATPRAWRSEGDMDWVPFSLEAATPEALYEACRAWKEGNIRLQGTVMRVEVKGQPLRTGMLKTDAACTAVKDGARPRY